jgi:hypothetical protein
MVRNIWEISFWCDIQYTGERIAHAEIISIIGCFKPMPEKLELTAIATRGGYKIMIAVLVVLQLILQNYDLMLISTFVYIFFNYKLCHLGPISVCL